MGPQIDRFRLLGYYVYIIWSASFEFSILLRGEEIMKKGVWAKRKKKARTADLNVFVIHEQCGDVANDDVTLVGFFMERRWPVFENYVQNSLFLKLF